MTVPPAPLHGQPSSSSPGGPVEHAVPELQPEEIAKLRRALARYRVMAMIVGTALVLLVFVAIPLQYGAHVTIVAVIVAPIHGYLYLVYLVAGADLARRAHWRLGRILTVVSAGFVPFLAFIIEHRITRQMREEWGDLLLPPDRRSGPVQEGSSR